MAREQTDGTKANGTATDGTKAEETTKEKYVLPDCEVDPEFEDTYRRAMAGEKVGWDELRPIFEKYGLVRRADQDDFVEEFQGRIYTYTDRIMKAFEEQRQRAQAEGREAPKELRLDQLFPL